MRTVHAEKQHPLRRPDAREEPAYAPFVLRRELRILLLDRLRRVELVEEEEARAAAHDVLPVREELRGLAPLEVLQPRPVPEVGADVLDALVDARIADPVPRKRRVLQPGPAQRLRRDAGPAHAENEVVVSFHFDAFLECQTGIRHIFVMRAPLRVVFVWHRKRLIGAVAW